MNICGLKGHPTRANATATENVGTAARPWLVRLATQLSAVVLLGACASAEAPKPKGQYAGAACEPTLVFECEDLCGNGDTAACEVAGMSYFEGRQVSQDLERAEALLTKACAAKRAVACGGLAKLSQAGHGSLSDKEIALRLKAACDAKDQDACQRVGQLMLAGTGLEKNVAQANQLFKSACESKSEAGCFQLALSLQTGRGGMKQDAAKASRLFTSSCNGKVGEACWELGQMQWSGKGAQKNPKLAIQTLSKGCELHSAAACTHLGTLYETGDGVTVDMARAVKFLGAACEHKSGTACGRLGAILLAGDGVQPDSERAFELLAQGCILHAGTACVSLGNILNERSAAEATVTDAVAEDALAASQAFQQACDAGLAEGCARLGIMLTGHRSFPTDPARAAELLAPACEENTLPNACTKLAGALLADRPSKTKKKAAVAALSQGCDRDHGESCTELGKLYEFGTGVARDGEQAATLYLKACQNEHATGCVGLATLAFHGIGTDRNPEAAIGVFETYCETDNTAACLMLSKAYRLGEGVERDEEKAVEIAKELCDNKVVEGCVTVARHQLTGVGIDKDSSGAKETISQGCSDGVPLACYYKTLLRTTSASERKKLLTATCQRHVFDACQELN